MSARIEVPKELLKRYATSAPRYTSYPTAVDWEKDPANAFDPADYPARLAAAADARPDEALSLYTHVPYCAEVSIEVDPRVTSHEQVALLGDLGFNRISMGIQDFEPDVQKAIKRVQSEELTRGLIDAARQSGMKSVNVDLIYGLPHQTRAGFARTVETVLDIAPERVALFHYAHAPWMKGHQDAMDVDAMPGAEEKLDIFADAIAAFDRAGYVCLGLDHFALPDDELSRAAAEGTLHRNFMGYTTQRGREMLSLGVSSIGEIDGAYVQNIANEPDYVAMTTDGGFATHRGHTMSADDKLRRDVILELLLDELRLTGIGQVLMRNVAVVFDKYLRGRKARGESRKQTFSKTL